MSRDFDAEIAEQENMLATLRDQMAASREAWLDLAAPWLANLWQEQARTIVVDQADHAQSMGAEGIKLIKAEVTALMGQARLLLAERLVAESGNELWPDLKPQTDTQDKDFRGTGAPGSSFHVFLWSEHQFRGQKNPDELRAPAQLANPMSKLEGEVLSIFRARGFRTGSAQYGSYEPGTYFRPLQLPWTREMVNAINEYAKFHEEYLDTLRRMETLRRDKSRTQASDLWENA